MSNQGSYDDMRKYSNDVNKMSNDWWVKKQNLGIPTNQSIPPVSPSPSKPALTPTQWAEEMRARASLGKQPTTGQQPSATGSGSAASGYQTTAGTIQTVSKKK